MHHDPVEPVTEQLPITALLPSRSRGEAGTSYLGAPIPLAGVAIATAVTVLAGAWAGLVPFLGPRIRFAPAGVAAWHWQLVPAVLGALPGAAAVAAGLVMLAAIWRVRLGAGRTLLVLAGLLAAASGAWLVVGPWAIPFMSDVSSPYASVAGAQAFGRLVGYQLGPGIALVGSGVAAAILGNRHRTVRLAIVGSPSPPR